MRLFVCIDDTDNYDSIGTGELLENMMGEAAASGLAKRGFIVHFDENCWFATHMTGNGKGSAKKAPFLLPYPDTTESLRPALSVHATFRQPYRQHQ